MCRIAKSFVFSKICSLLMDENIILDSFWKVRLMVPATCHIFLEHFCLGFSDRYFNFASFLKNIFRIGWYLCISRAYKIILDTCSSHCEDEWCLTLGNDGRFQGSCIKLWFCSSTVVINLRYGIPFHLLLWEESGLWRVFLAGIEMNIQHKGISNAINLILNYVVVVSWNGAVSGRKWLNHISPSSGWYFPGS